MADQSIPLGRLIETVADQIREAQQKAKGKPAVLDLAECELELAVQTSWDAKAGLRVAVVSLGGQRSKSSTSTIRLRFSPHGGPTAIAFQVVPAGPGPVLGRPSNEA